MTAPNAGASPGPRRARPPRGGVFSPPALAAPGLPPALRDAWSRTLSARRAAHLRAVAARLLARGADAPPMRCDVVLQPLFRGPAVVPVQLPQRWAGLDSMPNLGDPNLRRKRLHDWATRVWLQRDSLNFVWSGRSAPAGGMLFEVLRAWACAGDGLRFLLRPAGAGALLEYAAQVELAHGLPPQPALWLRHPHGRLRNFGLTLSHAARIAATAVGRWPAPQPPQTALDLLVPTSDPVAQALAQRVADEAQRSGCRWNEAAVRFEAGTGRVHVALETWDPEFARAEGWAEGGRWLALAQWPGVGGLIAGPAGPAGTEMP